MSDISVASDNKASKGISLIEKGSYGLGAFGCNIEVCLIYGFLMIYFTDTVGVSAAFVGVLFLFTRLFDAANDPFMGWIVDNTRTRWGKFRPWILIGAIVNALVTIALFWNPAGHMSDTMVMVWCATFYILWSMTFTIIDIPFWAVIPSFSKESKVRDIMSVIPRLFAMIGYNGWLIVGLPLITYLGVDSGNTQSQGYFRFALLTCSIFVLTSALCAINIREHVQTPKAEKISIKKILHLLVNNDQLLVIIILTICQQIAQNLVNGSILYFFKYIIRNDDLYPYFMATGSVLQFVGFIAFPFLVKWTSRKVVYVLAGLLMCFGYLGLFFYADSPQANEYLVSLLYGVASMGLALSIVSTTVMLADTVEYGQYKLGTRSESIVFSMQTMTTKFGSALAGFLAGMTLTLVGYVPNVEQTPETIVGLRVVLFVVSSLVLVLMVLIYVKFYKLHGEYFNNILNKLKAQTETK